MADCENKKAILRWLLPVILLVAVVVAVSISYLLRVSPVTMETLCDHSFNADEQMKIRFALADAQLNDYTLENGTLCVPVCRRDIYLQTLSKADVFVGETSNAKNNRLSIWRSEKERQECALREKQDVLSRQVRGFNGMDAACVLLDVSETKKGFSRVRAVTASVTIRSRADYTVNDDDIAAIRMFVAGAVAGLTPDNVAIVDTRTNRSWRVGMPVPAVATVEFPVAKTGEKTHRIYVHPPEPTYGDAPESVDDAAFNMLGRTDSVTEVYKPVTETESTVKKNDMAKWNLLPLILSASVAGIVILMGIFVALGGRRSRTKKPEPIVINVLEGSEISETPPCEPKSVVSELKQEPEQELKPESAEEEKLVETVVEKPKKEPVFLPVQESVALRQLRMTPADELAKTLEEERPQTIALVLAQLGVERGSEVLQCFDTTLRGDVVSRLAECEETDAEIVQDVLETVVERLDQDACRELPPVYDVSVRRFRVDMEVAHRS